MCAWISSNRLPSPQNVKRPVLPYPLWLHLAAYWTAGRASQESIWMFQYDIMRYMIHSEWHGEVHYSYHQQHCRTNPVPAAPLRWILEKHLLLSLQKFLQKSFHEISPILQLLLSTLLALDPLYFPRVTLQLLQVEKRKIRASIRTMRLDSRYWKKGDDELDRSKANLFHRYMRTVPPPRATYSDFQMSLPSRHHTLQINY